MRIYDGTKIVEAFEELGIPTIIEIETEHRPLLFMGKRIAAALNEHVETTLVDHMPHELTAPAIQRLVRKGVEQQLSDSECTELCQCVLFHVDAILEKRRVPRAPRSRSEDLRHMRPFRYATA